MYQTIPSITSSTTSSTKKVIVESFQSAVSALFSVSTFISLYSIDTVNEFRAAAHDTFGPKWFSLPSRPIDALIPDIDAEAVADAAFHQLMAEEEVNASSRSGSGVNVEHDVRSKKMRRAHRVSSPSSLQHIEPRSHRDGTESASIPIESRSNDVDAKMIPMDIPMEAQPTRCLSTVKVVTLIVIGLLAVSGCVTVYLSDDGTATEPLSFHEDTSQWMSPMDFVDPQGYNRRSLAGGAEAPPLDVEAGPPAVSGLPLFVRLSNGNTVTVDDVSPSSTVSAVAAALPAAAGWPEMLPQALSFAGRELQSEELLSEAGVGAEATLEALPLKLMIVHVDYSRGNPTKGATPKISHSYLVQVTNDQGSGSYLRDKPMFKRMREGEEEDRYGGLEKHEFFLTSSSTENDKQWKIIMSKPKGSQREFLMTDDSSAGVSQIWITVEKC